MHSPRKVATIRVYRIGGHVECRHQIGGKRFHTSWPSRDAFEEDLDGFFKLRALGVSIPKLIDNLDTGDKESSFLNLGPLGAIDFQQFCRKTYPEHRRIKPSWPQEEKRLAFILKQDTFNGREIHTIRRHEIQKWFDVYSNRPGVTSDNSRANMLKVMRGVFRVATKLGYLREDPSREIHLPGVPESRSRALTHNEAIRLYHAAEEPLRFWMLLTLHTGLRPIEISRLTVAQVNISERQLTVVGRTAKNRSRDIYIHDDLMPFMEDAVSAVPNFPLMRDTDGKPAMYPVVAFRRARKRAGLSNVTFYELRHTFCSRLLETGTRDEETRAYLMGHRLRGMTARYTHVTFDMVRDAIRRLPSVLVSPEAQKVDNKVDNEKGVESA